MNLYFISGFFSIWTINKDSFSRSFQKNLLESSLNTKNEMDSVSWNNIIVADGISIFELLSLVDQSLLINWDLLVRADMLLNLSNGSVGIVIDGNCFSSQSLNKNLTRRGGSSDGSIFSGDVFSGGGWGWVEFHVD